MAIYSTRTFRNVKPAMNQFLMLIAVLVFLSPSISQAQDADNDNRMETEFEWGFNKFKMQWEKRKKDRKHKQPHWGAFNPAKPALFYSFKQEFYGDSRESSCSPDGQQRSSLEMIEMSMGNMPFQTLFFGYLDTEIFFFALQGQEKQLQKILPGKGRNVLIDGIYGVQNTPLKHGKINNSLLAQTITLSLNMNLTPDRVLEDFPLEGGRWLVTQQKDPRSSCSNPLMMQCGWFGNSNRAIQSWRIPANVVNALGEDKTVWGLFCLAGYSLTGRALPKGVSLHDIENAVKIINEAFHEGRFFIGWSDRYVNCSNIWFYRWTAGSALTTAPENTSASATDEVGAGLDNSVHSTTVKAFPNPFVEKVQLQFRASESGMVMMEIYNLTGQRLSVLYKGYMQNGEVKKLDYYPGNKASSVLIYKVSANGKIYSGKLIKAAH